MVERTEDEKTMIALKAVNAISKEAATLWEQGHKKAAGVMLDYLVTADTDSLVLFHDILDQFKGLGKNDLFLSDNRISRRQVDHGSD